MQVYSAQTNKKIFVYGSGIPPPSFIAKLAWLIIVFFLIKMVNPALTDPPLDCWYSSTGICVIRSGSIAGLLRGSTHGGGREFAFLQSSSRDFCAVAVGPQRKVCHWPARGEFLFFVLLSFLISMNLMQQKFHGKLIVFGSAVFDDKENHIASVVLEYVNIFLDVFVGDFFSYLQMITFSTFVGFGLRVSSHCVLLNFESLNPNTWIPTHLFGFCLSLSGPSPPCCHPASPCPVWSRCRKMGERQWMACSPSFLGWSHHSPLYC